MKFPYEDFPSKEGVVSFPVVNITIINSATKKAFPSYKCIIDSGAAGCLFHAAIGESVGLDVYSGKKVPLAGATGDGKVQFLHHISLLIGGHMIDLEAGFSYDLAFPFGLLGQRGFFEKFRIYFNLPKKDFEIVPKG